MNQNFVSIDRKQLEQYVQQFGPLTSLGLGGVSFFIFGNPISALSVVGTTFVASQFASKRVTDQIVVLIHNGDAIKADLVVLLYNHKANIIEQSKVVEIIHDKSIKLTRSLSLSTTNSMHFILKNFYYSLSQKEEFFYIDFLVLQTIKSLRMKYSGVDLTLGGELKQRKFYEAAVLYRYLYVIAFSTMIEIGTSGVDTFMNMSELINKFYRGYYERFQNILTNEENTVHENVVEFLNKIQSLLNFTDLRLDSDSSVHLFASYFLTRMHNSKNSSMEEEIKRQNTLSVNTLQDIQEEVSSENITRSLLNNSEISRNLRNTLTIKRTHNQYIAPFAAAIYAALNMFRKGNRTDSFTYEQYSSMQLKQFLNFENPAIKIIAHGLLAVRFVQNLYEIKTLYNIIKNVQKIVMYSSGGATIATDLVIEGLKATSVEIWKQFMKLVKQLLFGIIDLIGDHVIKVSPDDIYKTYSISTFSLHAGPDGYGKDIIIYEPSVKEYVDKIYSSTTEYIPVNRNLIEAFA